MMRPSRHRPTMKALAIGLSLGLTVSLSLPASSHAIPIAGHYVFTSGLSGTFESDGTSLTDWNFLGPGAPIWTLPPVADQIHIVLNNQSTFRQFNFQPQHELSIELSWGPPAQPSLYFSILDFDNVNGTSRHWEGTALFSPVAPVPDPEGLVLLGLGLGLLVFVEYVRRLRHPAGLQVG